jgi:hypothetical protein
LAHTVKRLKRTSMLILGAVLVLAVCWTPSRAAQGTVLRPPDAFVPKTLFGMHVLHLFVPPYTPWPDASFGAWRLWDTYTAWPSLEPAKGKWNFSGLDKYVALAEQHHVEVMLTLGLTPQWISSRPEERSNYGRGNAAMPRETNAWRDYVRAVAERYKGKIQAYELWNEPTTVSKGQFSGSAQQMVQLSREAYQTLKQVDPSIIVVSPSTTGASGMEWLDQYLKAGGGKYADVIGDHLYTTPHPPEEIVTLAQQVERIMQKDGVGDKPLWDTETGYAIQNKQSIVRAVPGSGLFSAVLPEDEAAAYVARMYILAWSAGISRLYWYAWDNWDMGLVDRDGKTLKSPAIAYGQVEGWLVGATMTSCGSNAAETWICTITRPGGYHGWIMWNPTATRHLFKFPIPVGWHVTRVRDLLGHESSLAPGATFDVSIMPHLLEAPGR